MPHASDRIPRPEGDLRSVEDAVLARLLARFEGLSGSKGGTLTLEDIGLQYVEHLVSRADPAQPGTIRQARAALGRVLAGIDSQTVGDLSRAAVIRWRSARVHAGASHRTANLDVSILCSALNLAVELGQIEVSPLAGLAALEIKPKHRRRIARSLSEDECDALVRGAAEADSAVGGFPRAPLIAAFIDTCARWSELAVHTTWRNLDEDRGSIVFPAEFTKNGKPRSVPLAPDTLASIVALRTAHVAATGRFPTAESRIFLTPQGCPWTSDTSNFRRFLHEAMRRAKIPHKDAQGKVLHIHALRKTGSTRLARAGADLLTLQTILGHSDPKLTAMVYTDLEDERLRKAVLAVRPISRRRS